MENIDLQIENYLLGKMSPEDKANFEQFVSNNSSAKAELEMQKVVLEAIKQTRRLELKAKLSAINPSLISPWTQKIAITAVSLLTVTLVGVGIYTSLNKKQVETKKESEVTITDKSVANLSAVNEIKQVDSEIEVVERSQPTSESSQATSNSSSHTTDASKTHISANITKKVEKFDPLQYAEDEDDTEYGFGNDALETTKNNNDIHSSKIDYSVDKSYDFLGYKYDGKNLQLLGKFKGEAYIVERKLGMLILKYQGKVYKIIESNNKEERLEDHQISDSKILNQLK